MKFETLIQKPTLIIDVEKTRDNIRHMVKKAHAQSVNFRPHFKTHQSVEIGKWFQQEGVQTITVSSVEMASYFAQNGWEDITIAFPLNWREIHIVQQLAQQIRLGILVESVETIHYLGGHISAPVNVWIKIDVGTHRTGIPWENTQSVREHIIAIHDYPHLILRGLLTHAGHTYKAITQDEVIRYYAESVQHITDIQQKLKTEGFSLETSVGDTPGCSLAQSLGKIDEIRPGNFVFYDLQQLKLGACAEENIATVVACPIVAKHPERGEVVIYGGAIHLSKEYIEENGHKIYGYVALNNHTNKWGKSIPGAYLSSLSQEHGIVRFEDKGYDLANIGDILYVLPIHSCLVVSALGKYLTLSGQIIETMNKRS